MLNYPWITEIDVLAVDWMAKGHEWRHWFSEELGKRHPGLGVFGMKFDETTSPFEEITLGEGSNSIDTAVLIGVTTQGTHVFAAGNQEADNELIGQLTAASGAATVRMGDPGREFAWTAIVGYLPQQINGLQSVLAEEATIGRMKLKSADAILVEPSEARRRR